MPRDYWTCQNLGMLEILVKENYVCGFFFISESCKTETFVINSSAILIEIS